MPCCIYEPFLRAYDAEERIKRGVYYTPAAIGDLLVRDFGKHTGLGEQDVTVLDPALGTGTFLLQVLGAAIDSIVAVRGTGAQAAAIRDEVLPRVIGFEVLPAPYAIAQLRLETFLKSKGVSLGPNERARIYLSNTLNEPTTRSHHLYALPMLKTLVGEVNEADKVKADERVLVIVGNPPYERDSPFNDSKYINKLMEDFRKVDGTRIRDQNQKALNSDYVRFFRWAFAKLLEFQPNFGAGVVAFVSNNGYTDAATLVGMRRWMLDNFDDIYIFDLHGDQRNWIRGEPDEKVFKEVQVGIAITIAVRTPRPPPNEVAPGGFRATLHYREQRGTNAAKFGALRVSSIDDGQWNTLPPPEAPEYLFLPVGARTDYGKWPAVPDLFLKGSYGVGDQTSRDDFIVAFDPAELKARFADLASPTVTDDELRERYGLRTTRDFDLAAARRAAKTFDPKKVKQYRYRLLDRRLTYFDPIFIDWPRQVSEHLVDGENIALAVPRQRRGDGQLATVSREIVDLNLFGSGTHVYPLYQRSGAAALVSAHNFGPGLLSGLAVGLGRSVTPEDVFNYVAAVLMSAAYTDAFELRLGADHPRVSFTKNPTLFQDIVDAGKELTRLQSLRIVPAEYTSKLDGNGSATISRPTFDRANLRIVVGGSLFLTNVSEEAWTYKIGQYYVLERYLEDRVGRVLSSVDTTELIRVATAVDATIQIMPTLDDLVRRCIAGPTFVVAELQEPTSAANRLPLARTASGRRQVGSTMGNRDTHAAGESKRMDVTGGWASRSWTRRTSSQ